jgi:hypothetical protein
VLGARRERQQRPFDGPRGAATFASYPAVLFAFADGAGLMHHRDRPSAQRRIAGGRSFVISIEIAPRS